tara:strand:- start:3847 stop:4326 length:480 start_codon:yes stop_codon:yes gene_type:complete
MSGEENIELSEIAFAVYSALIIIMLEIYKEEKIKQEFTQESRQHKVSEKFSSSGITMQKKKLPLKTAISSKEQEVAPPKYGFLPRNIWKQAYYGGQSASPIPGTNMSEPIENSYSQTTTLVLANPFIREEACLPIEGNIGSKIELASELFGPFERKFIL